MGEPAEARNSKRSLRAHSIAILLLPLVVVGLRDDVLFTPLGWTDPWFYTGFATNLLEFKRYLFRDTYYGSRLAWILPNAAVHSLLPPVAAAVVLHWIVWAVATLSLFFTLRWIVGDRGAFLTAILFGMHPWLWAATGWDYPDGAALAYFLLATALSVHAALAPPRLGFLFLAGMAGAAAIHSNLFWAGLAPFALLTYAAMAYLWHHRPILRSVVDAVVWSGAAAVLLTAGLGVVNYRLDGNFWFFLPSIRQGQMLAATPIHWASGVWGAQGLNPALWFPVAALCVSSLFLVRARKRETKNAIPPVLFTALLGAALALLSWMQRTEIHALSYRYYTSALIPFAFLTAGAVSWNGVASLSYRAYLLICAAAIGSFAYVCAGAPGWPAASWRLAAVIAASALLLMSQYLRGPSFATLLAIGGFFLIAVESRPPENAPHTAHHSFQQIMQERQRLESVRRGRRVRFWFDEQDPEFPAYTSLISTYLMNWSFLNTAFPRISCESNPVPDTGIVVLSTRPDAPDLARRIISDCWRQAGLIPQVVLQDAVPGVAQAYSVTLFFAGPDPTLWRALPAAPFDQWNPVRGANLKRSTVGWKLRTSADPYYFAVVSSPFTAHSAGLYRFTLKYEPGSGQFAFGLFTPRTYNWIALDTSGVARQPGDTISVTARLEQEQPFGLAIANNNNFGRGAASLTIREVTAEVWTRAPQPAK